MYKKALVFISLLVIACGLAPMASAQLFGRAETPATWSAKAEMKSPDSGTIIITAEVAPRWHIYGTNLPDEVPVATEISFANTGLRLSGKMKVSPAPKVKHDEAFGADVPYWESGTVTFSQPFTLTSHKDAKTEIKITYVACSGFNCAPPKTETILLTIPQPSKK